MDRSPLVYQEDRMANDNQDIEKVDDPVLKQLLQPIPARGLGKTKQPQPTTIHPTISYQALGDLFGISRQTAAKWIKQARNELITGY